MLCVLSLLIPLLNFMTPLGILLNQRMTLNFNLIVIYVSSVSCNCLEFVGYFEAILVSCCGYGYNGANKTLRLCLDDGVCDAL